jgi:hypothetical protein
MKDPTPLETSLPCNTKYGEMRLTRRCYPKALNLDVWIQKRVYHQERAWIRRNAIRNINERGHRHRCHAITQSVKK